MLLGGASLVALAFVIINADKPQNIQYDFNRVVENVITEGPETDLIYNSFYIAGAGNNKIYLGNSEAPFTLLEYSADLKMGRHIRLRISPPDTFDKRSIRIHVFDSTVLLCDGRTPRIYTGLLRGDGCALHRFASDQLYFYNAVPVSASSVLLQGVSKPPYQNILCKESDNDSSYLIAQAALEKQVDGLFCTAGTLQFDKHLNLAVYVYSHRNEYLLLDTTLCLIEKANTIDTFSTARVRSIEVPSTHKWQLIAPESQVNNGALVSSGNLFVLSGLYTIHDDMDLAIHSSIFDIYDLRTRQYVYSFYLPNQHDIKFSSITISNNFIYAIYDHYLKSFRLKLSNVDGSGRNLQAANSPKMGPPARRQE
jgi:hypothetical protein